MTNLRKRAASSAQSSGSTLELAKRTKRTPKAKDEASQVTSSISTRKTRSSGHVELIPSITTESESSTSPEPGRRIKKKTAVVKTSDKAVIKIIQQNHMNSPLLSLPGEVRDKILRELVGDQQVHIKLRHMATTHTIWRAWDRKPSQYATPKNGTSEYVHHVCQNVREGSDTASDDAESSCHKNCMYPWAGDVNHLDLGIMGSCRQLYEETHHLLWASNTFIFDDIFSLSSFSSALNAGKRQKLNRIRIEAAPTVYLAASNYRMGQSKPVPQKILTGLSHLNELDVHIHLTVIGYGYPESSADVLEIARRAIDIFRPLQALSLEKASFKFSPLNDGQYPSSIRGLKDIDSKLMNIGNEFAATVLSPEGAEAERLRREAEKKAPRQWTEEEILKDYRGTSRAASQVLYNAKDIIYRADRLAVKVDSMMNNKGMDEDAFKARYSSTWYRYAKFKLERIDAKRRIRRFRHAELKKRELCNQRLKIAKAKRFERIDLYTDEFKSELFGAKAFKDISDHEGEEDDDDCDDDDETS